MPEIQHHDAIHVDCCPHCGMPYHGHMLDPPPLHPCKTVFEEAVPVLYVPEGSNDTAVDLLQEVVANYGSDPEMWSIEGWFEDVNDFLEHRRKGEQA